MNREEIIRMFDMIMRALWILIWHVKRGDHFLTRQLFDEYNELIVDLEKK